MFSHNNLSSRILLVDDDAQQIVVFNKALQRVGQVFFEQDGIAAFEQAIEALPDVIWLDIDMPSLNGHQVLVRLQGRDVTRHIPIIFITSHHSVENPWLCFKEGAVDFMSKPRQPDIVAARVNTQLTLGSRQREWGRGDQPAQVTLNSIDDFGTAFSCLSDLKELPVDVLKIDKSFVAQLCAEHCDDILVKTIATLAHGMKFKSVVKGIESTFQVQRLKALEVSYLQGYYFSRPVLACQIKSSYSL